MNGFDAERFGDFQSEISLSVPSITEIKYVSQYKSVSHLSMHSFSHATHSLSVHSPLIWPADLCLHLTAGNVERDNLTQISQLSQQQQWVKGSKLHPTHVFAQHHIFNQDNYLPSTIHSLFWAEHEGNDFCHLYLYHQVKYIASIYMLWANGGCQTQTAGPMIVQPVQ